MKLCCGDERARWGPAACPGWARASERERASLTDGRCNPAILPDTAHQNVLTTPPSSPARRPLPRSWRSGPSTGDRTHESRALFGRMKPKSARDQGTRWRGTQSCAGLFRRRAEGESGGEVGGGRYRFLFFRPSSRPRPAGGGVNPAGRSLEASPARRHRRRHCSRQDRSHRHRSRCQRPRRAGRPEPRRYLAGSPAPRPHACCPVPHASARLLSGAPSARLLSGAPSGR